MGLFVPLYGPFRAFLKRAMLMPTHGPRSRPKLGPALKYIGSYLTCAVLFSCFGLAHQANPKMYTYAMYTLVHVNSSVVLYQAQCHRS
jgi:hypothetical protein